MKLRSFSTLTKWFLPTFLFALLMVLSHSCELAQDEVCQEEEDSICEELIIACTSDSEEYYVLNGDTIFCAAVNDCDSADDELLSTCTIVSSADQDELKVELQAIMNKVRALKY